jgi:hypothetical protein
VWDNGFLFGVTARHEREEAERRPERTFVAGDGPAEIWPFSTVQSQLF